MKDETGNVYGRLTVIEIAERASKGRCIKWRCLCSCGNEKVVVGAYLRKGTTRSCGCLQLESPTLMQSTHGMSNTLTYGSYRAMVKRCGLKSDPEFHNYGGRGIVVCSEWDSFERFYADMGERPDGTTLDRIDVDGDYEPNNCRWADGVTQGNNRRNNRRITANGSTMTVAEWARHLGVSPTAIASRLGKGMTEEQAINTPFKDTPGLTINGETRTLVDWAKIANVNRNTITQRLKRMTPYQAVYAPIFKSRNKDKT